MVDGLQLFDKYRLGILDVAEGDGTLAEIPLGHLCVNQSFHQVANRLLGIVGQRARGSLDGVGHHQTGLFACERVRTGIGEQQVVDGLVGVLVMIADIEELGLAQSVVCRDKVADDLWQVVLVGYLQSLGDVADDDLRTLNVRQHLMWVDARLVFCEVDGVRQLADIVIERSCTYQLGLSSNLVGYLTSQVSHLDGVVERAGGYLAHLAQQLAVRVR